MRHAVASHGRAAGMNEADVTRAEELLDPDSPRLGRRRPRHLRRPAEPAVDRARPGRMSAGVGQPHTKAASASKG
jgi:hypothetical protein